MYSDTIADMLTRIRNGYLAKKDIVVMPYSKVKEAVAKVLIANNYLKESQVLKDGNKKDLQVTLNYIKGQPAVNKIIRVSKSGLRVYCSAKKLPYVLSGKGKAIISTSQGIMTNNEARKKSLGGEIICKIW